MDRTIALLVTALTIFCVSVGQICLSFASYDSTITIVASGNIKDYAVELDSRKHLIAYGLSSPVSEERIQQMTKFEVLDTSFRIGPDVARIKALNPNIIVLGYKDIMAIQPTDPDYPEVNQHEDWFLHDIHGDRLINRGWGWYAMDVGNPGWRSHYASYEKDKLDSYPYDGVFADDTWDTFFAGSGWNP